LEFGNSTSPSSPRTSIGVRQLVRSYLGSADANDPRASPLQGRLSGLPPIRIHVGDDEVLLDDSRRYAERAVAGGVDARLDVWTGMPHGFAGSIGTLKASAQALDAILLGRLGRLEEVSNVALFLASEETSYVTGADIVVDGGMKVW
jgi:acetyl esterase/lipase